MKCTKCNGSGSEGFISFLRCGRCSGTGEEPRDALVPYSDELIVVAKDGILAETAKLEKKQEEPEKKVEEAAQAVLNSTTPPIRRDDFGRYNYGFAARGPCPAPAPAPAPKNEGEIIHATHVFPISGEPGSTHPLNLSLTLLWDVIGSKDPTYYKIYLRKTRIECKGKYLVGFAYKSMRMFDKFYTGLGLDAKPIMGECMIDSIFSHTKNDFAFTFESVDGCFVEDRVLLTLFFEFMDLPAPTPRIYQPYNNYPGMR